jgi:hypothetical protein
VVLISHSIKELIIVIGGPCRNTMDNKARVEG